MDPYLWKRLWRRPWLSLCSLILSGVICFLLCYLSGYRLEQQERLAQTRESFDILCVVTDRKGTKSASLRIPSLTASFVSDEEFGMAEYVRDLRITKEFEYSCPELGIVSQPGFGDLLLGVSRTECADLLDPAMGGSVTYFAEDFYGREDYVCLVSEGLYEQMEGDTLTLSVIDPYVYSSINPTVGTGKIEFTVAGYYSGSGRTMFLPYAASQKLAFEISGRASTDSIAFYAVDNQQLEALSEAASEMYGTVDPMATGEPKFALTIHDEQYRATVAALEQNIERTAYLLPLVGLLGLGVGFLISFLSTRGESRTYALMRTLGMTRGKLFASIVREQMILALLAILAVALVTKNPGPAGIYLVCHSVGVFAAVVRSVRVAPTAILREQE